MVFSSLLFLFKFLPVVLALYFIAVKVFKGTKRPGNAVLFVSSLVFYAWGEPVYVCLMLFSTVVDYVLGRLVDHFKSCGRNGAAKACVIISAVVNLSLLGFFKYSAFLITTVNEVFRLSLTVPKLALPIGISFYTFQTMSYTIDVYRGDAKFQKNIIDFGTYVALFPQLIAGPIVRYQTIAEELPDRHVTAADVSEGIRRFVLGLGKKVLLANAAGALFDTVKAGMPQAAVVNAGMAQAAGTSSILRAISGPSQFSVMAAWLGIIAFTFQIYFDFSGYSDMAIGLGRMFGFHFLENFDYPYMSLSITEFWRRWHISLGTWFREYVYIPLGGNRCSRGRQIRNLAIVWLLTGLWHGASWNFLIWGAYYGMFLILEKFVYGESLERAPKFVKHLYVLLIVVVGWVIFSFDSAGEGLRYLGCMFGCGGVAFANKNFLYLLSGNAIMLVVMALLSTDVPKRVFSAIFDGESRRQGKAGSLEQGALAQGAAESTEQGALAQGTAESTEQGALAQGTAGRAANFNLARELALILILLLSIAYLVDASYNPFLYFRF